MNPKLVVLISGRGSNLKAIINNILAGKLKADLAAVITDKADAKGLEHAAFINADTHVLDSKDFASRYEYDKELIKIIDAYAPRLVVLAGFMRILSPEFVEHYAGRLINIHPSLLPEYKGLATHKRVLESGDKVHGATVHFVTEELDSGPIIIQAKVPVLADDTVDTLAARVLAEEHKIYSAAIKQILK